MAVVAKAQTVGGIGQTFGALLGGSALHLHRPVDVEGVVGELGEVVPQFFGHLPGVGGLTADDAHGLHDARGIGRALGTVGEGEHVLHHELHLTAVGFHAHGRFLRVVLHGAGGAQKSFLGREV